MIILLEDTHVRRRAALSSFIALALLGIVALPVRAMEFSARRIDDTFVIISATGDIAPGDSDRLVSVLVTLPTKETHVLALNSFGGSVVASQSVAATIRQSDLGVFVGDSGTCASACFVLFAASAHKFYMHGARIGVHSAVRGGYETFDSMAMTTVMARTVSGMGVPDEIVGRMIRTPPGQMAWLTDAELASMRATVIQDNAPKSPPVAATAPSTLPAVNAPAPPAVALAQPGKAGTVPADPSSDSYRRGLADRTAWEQWFGGITGDFHDGAEYWTGERSKPRPGSCNAVLPDYMRGCLEAKRLLTASDYLRKNDKQYWWGWNSYAASTPISTSTPALTLNEACRLGDMDACRLAWSQSSVSRP